MRAQSDDELVQLVQKHAREVHSQDEPNKEQVLAMAQPE